VTRVFCLIVVILALVAVPLAAWQGASSGTATPLSLDRLLASSGLSSLSWATVAMMLVGIGLLWVAIARNYEPLLLVPIGFGILVGNLPLPPGLHHSVALYVLEPGMQAPAMNGAGDSVLGFLYAGVRLGILPSLILLGIGANTDFSPLLARPRGFVLGAAAQIAVFLAFAGASWLGFAGADAAAIGLAGSGGGPTAVYAASQMSPGLLVSVSVAVYAGLAIVPALQQAILRLLTSRDERLIRMTAGRPVARVERIAFPVIGLVVTALLTPAALPLVGMLFLGNLLRESGVTGGLAKTAANALLDTSTILFGVAIGISAAAGIVLTTATLRVVVLVSAAMCLATAVGVVAAKLLNAVSEEKINPLIGGAAASVLPGAARSAHAVAQAEDPANQLLQHAMGPNVAGVIGSAIAAGVFLGLF
jgi:oxaloacetate decarboxylase beta subunit